MCEQMSPCSTCLRVLDPENCENKECRLWQRWFVGRWEQLRQYPRRVMDLPGQPAGVYIGGKCYAHPDQVRGYLTKDPCGGCRVQTCKTPCRARQNWAVHNRELCQ